MRAECAEGSVDSPIPACAQNRTSATNQNHHPSFRNGGIFLLLLSFILHGARSSHSRSEHAAKLASIQKQPVHHNQPDQQTMSTLPSSPSEATPPSSAPSPPSTPIVATAASASNPPTPRATALNQAGLPSHIKAVAMRNAKKRFFVPSSDNTFGAICFTRALVDSGRSTVLLPCPGRAILESLARDECLWRVGSSSGVGLVDSVVLMIKHCENDLVGGVKLAGLDVMPLPHCRIHLNSAQAAEVIAMGKSQGASLTKIQPFAAADCPNNKPRHHVLLGQTVLDRFISVQHRNAFVMCTDMPSAQDMMEIHQLLNTLEKPPGFDLCEDDDHDGDFDWDREEFCDPWSEDELMDEIDGCPKNFCVQC